MKPRTWLLTLLAFSSCILPALARDPDPDPEPQPEEQKVDPTQSLDNLPDTDIVCGIEILSMEVNNLVAKDTQPVLALCTMNDKDTIVSVNGVTKSLEQFLDKDFKEIKEKAKRDVSLLIAIIVTDKVPSWKSFKKIEEAAHAREVPDYSIVRFRFAEPKTKEETKPEAKTK